MGHPKEKTATRGLRHQRRMEHDLASALRVQRLLAEISSRFVTRLAGEIDETIEEIQQLICGTLQLDRSTLWLFSEDGSELALAHFWQQPGSVPLRRNYVTNGRLPWAEERVTRGETFHFSSLGDLPPEAAIDVETLRTYGTKSNATFPLVADGKVFGALAFAMITVERHWSDDELTSLKLTSQIFSHVISRRRAELRAEQLREEIQRSSRAAVLGEIAAALAHEINQPLTAILGNAQAARRFIAQGNADPMEILAILDDIIRDDKRAGEVIRNLRAMLSGSPMHREPSCLNELVTEVCAFLASDLASEGIELQLDLSPSLPCISLAPLEVRQVIINLIGNASLAMSETPAAERRILILTRASGNFVQLHARDHGHGIALEHLDRIFEPFHTTRPNGLGMGLSICRRVAEAHGGTLRAANHESGAVFTLTLPLVFPAGKPSA
jgi:signal transduction histidine kinase